MHAGVAGIGRLTLPGHLVVFELPLACMPPEAIGAHLVIASFIILTEEVSQGAPSVHFALHNLAVVLQAHVRVAVRLRGAI
jgi:hypothetical protein